METRLALWKLLLLLVLLTIAPAASCFVSPSFAPAAAAGTAASAALCGFCCNVQLYFET